MARYTLKVFYGTELIERFDHRNKPKLRSILEQSRYHMAGQTGPFGEVIKHPDNFEILDSGMEKIHKGNIKETLLFIGTLK
jgi:hypothetical protein